MRIIIETIPHNRQRYDTCGDWQFIDDEGTLLVRVSELPDPRMEFCAGMHEAIEAFLARNDGVSEQDVDRFDMAYERDRPEGDLSEPGDDPRCPVYRQHQFATGFERMLIAMLGLDWNEYERAINDL